jgi:hypothetical protein
MDLSSYLRSVKRFAWLLVIIPLLVGAGTAAWTIHRSPSLHSGTVSVALPITTGIQAETDELADDFTYAASVPTIQDSAAKQAGISTTALQDGLHVTRVGTVSTYMKVTFNSKVLSQAQSVPPNVALQSLTYVLSPRIQIAKNLQSSLAKDSAAVTAQQQALLTKALRKASPSDVATVSGEVKSTPAYAALTSKQNQLLTQENQAATAVDTLTADLDSAKSLTQSATAVLTTTSSTKTVAQHTVANAAAALFLLLLLLVTLELIRPSEPDRRPAAADNFGNGPGAGERPVAAGRRETSDSTGWPGAARVPGESRVGDSARKD